MRISVIGDGSWGTTLAVYLARRGHPVRLWGAFPENVRRMQRSRCNERYLPGIALPEGLQPIEDIEEAVRTAEVILLAVPSEYVRSVLTTMRGGDFRSRVLLSVVKGIEAESLMRVSEIAADVLGPVNLAVLSGPTIAREVVQGLPTTAVVACRRPATARILQNLLNSKQFRIYTNTDVVGTELGGSLKNVIALAAGICDGLGYGSNAKAAILTRGLVEMARLGRAMGAKASTFSGLAGLGDLVTTCISPQSRNRYVGEQIGRGRTLTEIRSTMVMVAEGVATARSVYRLSRRNEVEMPISREVYRILYRGKSPRKAVSDLMARRLRSE